RDVVHGFRMHSYLAGVINIGAMRRATHEKEIGGCVARAPSKSHSGRSKGRSLRWAQHHRSTGNGRGCRCDSWRRGSCRCGRWSSSWCRRWRTTCEVVADYIHHTKVHGCQVVLHAGTGESVETVVRAAGPVLRVTAIPVRKIKRLEKRGPVIDGKGPACAVIQTPHARASIVEQIK